LWQNGNKFEYKPKVGDFQKFKIKVTVFRKEIMANLYLVEESEDSEELLKWYQRYCT